MSHFRASSTNLLQFINVISHFIVYWRNGEKKQKLIVLWHSNYFAAVKGAKYCYQRVSPYVCLSVCLCVYRSLI